MSFIEDLADKLARDVLSAREEVGDAYFYEKVSKVLGAASPTVQEAFMTSIRIRLAEERGRMFLYEALAAIRGVSAKEIAATMGSVTETQAAQPAPAAAAAAQPKAAESSKPKPSVSAAAKARMISEALAAFGDDPVPPRPTTPHSGT